MTILLVRLIECDGCHRTQCIPENESARQARYYMAHTKGWSRRRRNGSMVDLCKECSTIKKH
jgi:hypothetical protein